MSLFVDKNIFKHHQDGHPGDNDGYVPIVPKNIVPQELKFVVIPGRWQHRGVYERYLAELNINHSAEFVALEGKPGTNVIDDAKLVVEAAQKYKRVILIAHSLGAVAAGHAANVLDNVAGMQLWNTGGPHDRRYSFIDRYAPGFTDGINDLEDGTNEYLPEPALQRFFNDVEDNEYAAWLANSLQPFRSDDKLYIPPPVLPTSIIPITSIRGTRDLVHGERWTQITDETWIKTDKPISIEAGHTPFASKPKESAELSIRLGHMAYARSIEAAN
jgi:pimeloyl-ACP methyl ester carboxylesterase